MPAMDAHAIGFSLKADASMDHERARPAGSSVAAAAARQATQWCRWCSALLLGTVAPGSTFAGGVTIITHGYDSDVTSWIIPMSERIPGHPGFSGTTYSCYKIAITSSGGQLVATSTLLNAASPLQVDSGEIFVKLDWSEVSALSPIVSTGAVAQATVSALLSSGFVSELAGRRLVEMPVHLIGHSRGASVATEMARLLGAQGIWVDQVTTLDPRPVGLFGDATVRSWANVLYEDNFWQTLGSPSGQTIAGSYNRQLLVLGGGYSSSHSDVHLWYHGTIELTTPASDTQANLFASERSTWWTAAEAAGATAGFYYSRVGGGDRLSSLEPAGAGNGRISDGFNKNWDLGGGVAPNRVALPANAGLWPNPIRFALGSPQTIPAGTSFGTTLHYQAGASATGTIDAAVVLDLDRNPYNGNEIEAGLQTLSKTGTSTVAFVALNTMVNAATTPPGTYCTRVRLSDGATVRHLDARDLLVVTPSLQAPFVDGDSLEYTGDAMHFTVHGYPGQVVTVMASTDLITWTPLQTHTLAGTIWEFVDNDAGNFEKRFYKVVLGP